jgi:hypothetical protein
MPAQEKMIPATSNKILPARGDNVPIANIQFHDQTIASLIFDYEAHSLHTCYIPVTSIVLLPSIPGSGVSKSTAAFPYQQS